MLLFHILVMLQFAVWISQLNVTYTPLENIMNNSACTFILRNPSASLTPNFFTATIQPGGSVYSNGLDPIVNGTMFVALTDTDLFGVLPLLIFALFLTF